jgi:hypothetical protein
VIASAPLHAFSILFYFRLAEQARPLATSLVQQRL